MSSDDQAAVFVTGANGGIGSATVKALVDKGFLVFAGVRDPATAPPDHPMVHPVLCDVTDVDSVARAATTVAARLGGRRLAAVVNNAGLIVQGPLEVVPLSQWRQQFEVNMYGPVVVNQAFLPLLRASRGRIINISATSARTSLPFFGPIGASKAALESYSHAARVELAPWHIPVVIIEPGGTETAIFAKAAAAQPEVGALYRGQLAAFGTTMGKQKLSAPEDIAKVIVRAVTARRPKPRYAAGTGARMAGALSHLPMRTRDRVMQRFLGLHKVSVSH